MQCIIYSKKTFEAEKFKSKVKKVNISKQLTVKGNLMEQMIGNGRATTMEIIFTNLKYSRLVSLPPHNVA